MSVLSALSSLFHRSGSYDLVQAAKAHGIVRNPTDASDAKARAEVMAVLQEAEARIGRPATSEARLLKNKIARLIDHAARSVGRHESAPLPTLQEAQALRDRANFDPKVRPEALQSLNADLEKLVQLRDGMSPRSRLELDSQLEALSRDVAELSPPDAPDRVPVRRIAELHERVSGMRDLIEASRQRHDLWTALAHGRHRNPQARAWSCAPPR